MGRGLSLKLFLVALVLGLTSIGADAGNTVYVYTDHQGTPLAEANSQGVVTASFDYRPYGVQAAGVNANGPGFTGHVNDADAGFVYMQARYYDPQVGRFLGVDPIDKQPVSGLYQLNRYSYTLDNPVIYIDPDGRQEIFFSSSPVEPNAMLRAGLRPTPLSEAIRQGIRNPIPRTAAEKAADLAREAGLKPRPRPQDLREGKQEPWIPQEIKEHPLKRVDDFIDVLKLIAELVKNLHGHPAVTVGPDVPPPSNQQDPNASPNRNSSPTPSQQPTPEPSQQNNSVKGDDCPDCWA